ncbi:hypothetical protein B0F90DRAFT_1308751 [Multifurca ochricompacta]|uniref:Uncharacterized protein n=1 Tax=Multifurca ochricompacta TaxID=376703 RepID=A0AAD4M8K8_9AGAM|nr:hypothetical protein B0F90DRAFT_1308751 [Multifurca ochricompacta]
MLRDPSAVQEAPDKAFLPVISPFTPRVQQSLVTPLDVQPDYATASKVEMDTDNTGSPTTAMGVTRYAQLSSAPPPFSANVPGIWAIQVGKPSATQIDISFEVDQDTAGSVLRWVTQRQGFNPDARHVVVHLVVLPAAVVSTAHHNLSQSPGGMTPQAFALALGGLQPQWPDDGSLVLQLNAGMPSEQTWFTPDMVRFLSSFLSSLASHVN